MADLLMDNNACMVVGAAAWHGKGVRLDHPPSTPEALRAARLDWEVEKVPVYAHVPLEYPDSRNVSQSMKTTRSVKTNSFATVRRDELGVPHVLGVVGRRYEVLQNREAFSVFDDLLLGRGCTYESAGAVRDGRRVWILARIPDRFRVGGDEIRKYFLLVLSHDGSTPLILRPTPVRVVCNNTLNIALGERGSSFAIKHLRGIRTRLSEVTEAITMADMDFEKARGHMERMAETKLEDPSAYFMRVMPGLARWTDPKLKRNVWRQRMVDLTDLFHVGRGNAGKTVWDGYNAVTEWVDHKRAGDHWVEYTQFGGGDAIKRNAFAAAVDMTEKRTMVPVGMDASRN